ncbi:GerAB/ArcD/ProY family transporter [Pseudalkalibacillus caeni]|uniref:Spore gernimation protein GerB n=1 Tax=Exobacillus caeni TaxID=2574798 RepID=A0A5R9F3N6_9BACL|nr:GerAB/ArcD/ProY family transporter [Pseudalkalibacillus caeni]TLS38217.1 spore gernimation protein GerB [Pseudalkalibacillus caeni]
MHAKVEEQFKISPYLVFFLVHSIQLGVGILGFQRVVAKTAQQDAWISVILAGASLNIVLWLMYRILRNKEGDVIWIQQQIFGKMIGGLLGTVWIVYFLAMSATVLRTYIEVVQVWMFPKMETWALSLAFLILTYYCLAGGFRVVAGICFFGVVLPMYLILGILFPLEFAHFYNLLPVMNHSAKDILLSAKDMSLSYIGFTTLFIYYPFIKNPQKSYKWAQFGILFTVLIYLMVMVTTLVFYSQEQLEKLIWATLTAWKIVQLPFVERFEYIGISSWAIVVLPNICLSVWAAGRAARSLTKMKQRPLTLFFLLLIFIATILLKGRTEIDVLNDMVGRVGFYIIYGYIPFLFIVNLIYERVKHK